MGRRILAGLGHLGLAVVVQLFAAWGLGIGGLRIATQLYRGRMSIGLFAAAVLIPIVALVPLVVLVRRTSATAQAWRLVMAYFLIAFFFVFLRMPHGTEFFLIVVFPIAALIGAWMRRRHERAALLVLIVSESIGLGFEAHAYVYTFSCVHRHPKTLEEGAMLAVALGVAIIALGRKTALPGFGEEPRVLWDGPVAPSAGQLSIAPAGRLSLDRRGRLAKRNDCEIPPR